mmetsp:Transcript_19996/g.50413  ORF Transcript_19996/g.50413 Transcript_19996/m.50413 type:complete len:342 (+) Transcript_19996:1443-2468(+)
MRDAHCVVHECQCAEYLEDCHVDPLLLRAHVRRPLVLLEAVPQFPPLAQLQNYLELVRRLEVFEHLHHVRVIQIRHDVDLLQQLLQRRPLVEPVQLDRLAHFLLVLGSSRRRILIYFCLVTVILAVSLCIYVVDVVRGRVLGLHQVHGAERPLPELFPERVEGLQTTVVLANQHLAVDLEFAGLQRRRQVLRDHFAVEGEQLARLDQAARFQCRPHTCGSTPTSRWTTTRGPLPLQIVVHQHLLAEVRVALQKLVVPQMLTARARRSEHLQVLPNVPLHQVGRTAHPLDLGHRKRRDRVPDPRRNLPVLAEALARLIRRIGIGGGLVLLVTSVDVTCCSRG